MASPRRQQQRFTPLDERFTFIGDGVSTGSRDALRPVLFEVEERAGGGELGVTFDSAGNLAPGAGREMPRLCAQQLRVGASSSLAPQFQAELNPSVRRNRLRKEIRWLKRVVLPRPRDALEA